jgi:hypothetical protein
MMESAIRTDRAHSSGKVIPAKRVRVVELATTSPSPHDDKLHEPQVTLVKDGDAVKAIIITCPCGKQTRLECEY